MKKSFVGPRLRQIRRDNDETQAQMAARLGISPSYVNLLESNQRALSVPVMMALSDTYGLDWRDLVADADAGRLAELRAAMRDPVFADDAPDLQELRAALEHAPRLVARFLALHATHRAVSDRLDRLSGAGHALDLMSASPETAIHDVFRRNANHFPALERRAATLRERIGGTADDLYAALKRFLRMEHAIEARVVALEEMPDALRLFDRDGRRVLLSEALDHVNRVFQLVHVLGRLSSGDTVEEIATQAGLEDADGRARLAVELTNYFAAAFLMPYDGFRRMAEATRYDIDRLAAAFGVSFEQVCHRLTTLQREGARGVPFFFLRIDRAGNVTKRFTATGVSIAEQGGACPVWDIHGAFRAPGVIHPQFVEMPDGARFFTISRTTDRPVFSRISQDRRLVVALGCDVAHADRVGYARPFNLDDPGLFVPIGTTCALCPRQACAQRAAEPLHMRLRIDTDRRGGTRFES